MKKIAIALLALILLTGCAKVEEMEKPEAENVSRFAIVEKTSIWEIIVDKDTHVMYAVSLGGYNAGTFTLLVDAEGEPLIYKEEQE